MEIMSRVSEDARNCVVFLGYETGNPADAAEIVPVGTGFLVYSGEGGYRGVYLVTAAHVARKLGSDPFEVRQNDSGAPHGSTMWITLVGFTTATPPLMSR